MRNLLRDFSDGLHEKIPANLADWDISNSGVTLGSFGIDPIQGLSDPTSYPLRSYRYNADIDTLQLLFGEYAFVLRIAPFNQTKDTDKIQDESASGFEWSEDASNPKMHDDGLPFQSDIVLELPSDTRLNPLLYPTEAESERFWQWQERMPHLVRSANEAGIEINLELKTDIADGFEVSISSKTKNNTQLLDLLSMLSSFLEEVSKEGSVMQTEERHES